MPVGGGSSAVPAEPCHGLKDPDNAIKSAGIEPVIVKPSKEAVMKVIGL